MELEWNLQKASDNLRKHGVDFADAVIALEDDNALTIEDKDHDEQRFKTLGMDQNSIFFMLFIQNVIIIVFELFQLEEQNVVKLSSTIRV